MGIKISSHVSPVEVDYPLVWHIDSLRKLQSPVVVRHGRFQVSLRDKHVCSVAPPVHVPRGILDDLVKQGAEWVEWVGLQGACK